MERRGAHVSVVHAHAGHDDVVVLPDAVHQPRRVAGREAVRSQAPHLAPGQGRRRSEVAPTGTNMLCLV